jgi:hypothetical protein
LLVECQLRSRPVIVAERQSEGLIQMRGVQEHEMVQALSPEPADYGLGVRLLPGTLTGRQDFFHASRGNARTNFTAVDAVTIANEIRGSFSTGEALDNLLSGPG